MSEEFERMMTHLEEDERRGRLCHKCGAPMGPDDVFRCQIGRCWQYNLVYCEDHIGDHDHGLAELGRENDQ